MASGPYKDERRGTWSVQWWNGIRWSRTVVVKKKPGWKPGDPMPKTPPPAAKAAMAEFIKKEEAARKRKGYHPDRPAKDFLADYLGGYDIGRQPGSRIEAGKAVAVFLTWCESRSIKRLEDITAEVCHQWMADRAATTAKRSQEPIAFATLKKERALLATAWSEALRRGRVESNPWVSVEVPGKPSRKKRGSWSVEEYEKLIAASKPWLRDFLIVGCHTGLRVEALIGIEWRDVKHAREGQNSLGHLIVRPELDKTGKGYEVPIHPKVNEILLRRFIHNKADHDHILAGMHGGIITKSELTSRAIIRACARAGLDKPDSPNHHMRRTFGRWAVLGPLRGSPVPMYVVSQWLGHSSIQMTQHYLDLREADSARWMMSEEDELSSAK